MSLRPQICPTVPEETVRIARASFPKGSRSMRLRDELGAVFDDSRFAARSLMLPSIVSSIVPPLPVVRTWMVARTGWLVSSHGRCPRLPGRVAPGTRRTALLAEPGI